MRTFTEHVALQIAIATRELYLSLEGGTIFLSRRYNFISFGKIIIPET
jgi:hypothetical protein